MFNSTVVLFIASLANKSASKFQEVKVIIIGGTRLTITNGRLKCVVWFRVNRFLTSHILTNSNQSEEWYFHNQ